MTILGLDLGSRTIGVAALDRETGLAVPRFVLARRGTARDLDELRARAPGEDVEAVVVGLPLRTDGAEGPEAKAARRFADAVREAWGLPVHLQDESFSTAEAEARLREAGLDSRAIRTRVDAVAAAVILEDWLAAGG